MGDPVSTKFPSHALMKQKRFSYVVYWCTAQQIVVYE